MFDNFRHSDKYYKNYKTITPFKNYKENIKEFMRRYGNIEISDVEFKRVLSASGFRDPSVDYYERDLKTFDKERKSIKMSEYLTSIYPKDLIVVPSLTCYRKDILSLDAEWTDANVAKRNNFKKQAKEYKQLKDNTNFLIYNTLQKTKKIRNNGLSGTYSLENSPLHTFSEHYTLTSMTRITAGIGNLLTERMIGGNRFYRVKDDVINEFLIYIRGSNLKKVESVIQKYNLYIPNVDEIMEMVEENSKWYWEDDEYMKVIRKFVESLSTVERAIIMFAQDLYYMFIYNREFIKDFFDKFTYKCGGISTDIEILKSGDYDILNGLHMIHYQELLGKPLNYDLYKGKPIAESMVSTYIHMRDTLNEYQDFIDAFFKDVMVIPSNVTYVKEMVRKVIVLSDTDSTCATYFGLIKREDEKFKLDSKFIARLSGLVIFVSKSLKHCLRLYTANTNTDENYYKRISMKPEYVWSIFLPALGSKHYLTSEIIQELYISGEETISVSGVSLIASNLPDYFAKRLKEFQRYITQKQESGELLSIKDMVDEILELEEYIIDGLKRNPGDVVRTDKIQPEDAYALEWKKSNYFHYVLWDRVFSKKYGKSPDAPYRAYKIPLTTSTKKKMNEYIESLEDREMQESWRSLLKESGKEKIELLRLPITNIQGKGVPEELKDIIDYKRTVLDILKPWYMLMESLGVIKYEGYTYHELFTNS